MNSFRITDLPTKEVCSFTTKSPLKSKTTSDNWFSSFWSTPSTIRTRRKTITNEISKRTRINLSCICGHELRLWDFLIWIKSYRKLFHLSFSYSSETSSIQNLRISRPRPICINTTFCFSFLSTNLDSWKQKCRVLYWISLCFQHGRHQIWISFSFKCIISTFCHWFIQMAIDK